MYNMSRNHMTNKLSQISMMPLILPEDKPLVKKSVRYKINDIVVFYKLGRLIAHRIIYASPSKKYYVTKGDNKNKDDGKIYKTQILGKIEAIERNGRKIKLSHLYLAQSSVYLEELKKINNALVRNKIDYIVLKGLPLHIHFNHAPPQRIYYDADLLINKEDLEKTTNILKKLGFRKIQPKLHGKKVKNASQVSFLKGTKPFYTAIDLHLEPAIGFTKLRKINQLLPPTEPFQKHLFKNIKHTLVNETEYPILEIETTIVLLLLHFFHHNFQGAHRALLIDSLIRKQKIDWSKLIKIICKFQFQNQVYLGLLVLKRYYKTPVPYNKISLNLGQKLLSCILIRFISPFSSGGKNKERIKRFAFVLLLSSQPLTQKIKILRHKKTRSYFLPTIKSFFSRS